MKLRGNGRGGDGEREQSGMWTDEVAALRLTEEAVQGRLNGWDFKATRAIWRDTRLILRQDNSTPAALRLELTFPLKGGELVPGKTFRLGLQDPPFAAPIRIRWKDDNGVDQQRPCPSGYVMWIEFDEVNSSNVSGRIHLCLPDPTRSWVAGRFTADVRTVVD